VALVGSHSSHERDVIATLTGLVSSRGIDTMPGLTCASFIEYESMDKLLNDRKRPDLDLLVEFAPRKSSSVKRVSRVVCSKASMSMWLDEKSDTISFSEGVVRVHLRKSTKPEDMIRQFEVETARRTRGEKPWPKHLVRTNTAAK
jgi:hypothetical protein